MPSYPQTIPRPDDWRMGAPAPWLDAVATDAGALSVDRIVAVLVSAGLGGAPAAATPRDNDLEVLDGLLDPAALRSSAVLLALFEEDGEARVVLTRRSSRLSSHRGEVSFPGGRVDDGEGPVDAALREADEEVGIDPATVEVVGHLHPIVTLASRSLITPVVGVLAARPTLVPAPAEVERAFDVALGDLLAPGVFHEERWRRPERPSPRSADGSFPLWFFEIAGEMIWGATGRLLVDLLCLALDVDAPGEVGS
jgi:8-oxo-dGTP pyrophosphatase MutT (NUDIX family)